MLPLSGMKVIDWTMAVAGPFGGLVMTDLGAEVIHVDRLGPRTSQVSPELCRNKRTIAIDMKAEEGKEILRKLVKDV